MLWLTEQRNLGELASFELLGGWVMADYTTITVHVDHLDGKHTVSKYT